MEEVIPAGPGHDVCRRSLLSLQEQVLTLKRRVDELESRVGKNSRNSSKPPSSDPPWIPSPKSPITSNRKPGGQPGHPPHQRPLLPPGQVDRMVQVHPRQCRGCGSALRGVDPDPLRHQVTELPPIVPWTIEYRLHRLVCGHCAVSTRAELPRGVPQGQWGPRLTALMAYLSVRGRMSKRLVQEFLADALDVQVSLGAIVEAERRISDALAQPYEAVLEHVQGGDTVNADETGWAQKSRLHWLWAAVTRTVAVFRIDPRRNAKAAQKLLGDFKGILGTDRFGAYHGPPLWRRQLCWAHLIRDFQAMIDRGQGAQRLGRILLAQTEKLFDLWHRIRDRTLSWGHFRHRFAARGFREIFHRLLRRGQGSCDRKSGRLCKRLLNLFPALWTFTRIPGIEPTNNAAERDLRHAVIYRKACFGTWSAQGSRFVERMLTAAATLRKQHRSVLEYLTRTCRAFFAQRPIPSLLPS